MNLYFGWIYNIYLSAELLSSRKYLILAGKIAQLNIPWPQEGTVHGSPLTKLPKLIFIG